MPGPQRGTRAKELVDPNRRLGFCRRRRGIEVDEALTVAHLGLVGLECDEAGRLRGLAARHMEFAEMEGALDLLAVERSVGEVGHAVGAARLGGVVGPVDVVDGDELVADLAADHAVRGDIGGGTNLNGRHMLSGSHGAVGGYPCFSGMAKKCKGARSASARITVEHGAAAMRGPD